MKVDTDVVPLIPSHSFTAPITAPFKRTTNVAAQKADRIQEKSNLRLHRYTLFTTQAPLLPEGAADMSDVQCGLPVAL